MPKLTAIFLSFLIVLSFIPQLQPAFAASACRGLSVGDKSIDWFPIDDSGNRINFIPAGQTAIKLEFVNLGPGQYRLEFPKRGPAYHTPENGYATPDSNGTIIFTITDSEKLQASTGHAAKLQTPTKDNYCEGISYPVGYQKGTCSLIYTPKPLADNQQFIIQVYNAPSGGFNIMNNEHDKLPQFNPGLGSINIDGNGRGTSELIHSLGGPGTYDIYLAQGAPEPGWTNDPTTSMCSTSLEVSGHSSNNPTPTCIVSTSGNNYTLRAFNLRPGVDYSVFLNHNGDSIKIADRNSFPQAWFDQALISNPAPGTYIASVKDADGKGCNASSFIIGANGQLGSGAGFYPGLPNAGSGYAGCPAGTPGCTAAAGTACDGDTGISTAIGCIHTDPVRLIQDVLSFVGAVAGGIAFLLMLIGSFQMITSAGNPETLKAGQERFTSAIIGLLFVIFAVLLLKIIGVDILNLGKYFGI